MQVQTRGEFGGLGIEVTMEDGLVKVVTPIDDTPAAHAGVRAGDIITEIDGESVKASRSTKPSTRCAGRSTPKSSSDHAQGRDKPIDVTIVRDVIRVKSVRSHSEGEDVGYIRITEFNEKTTDDLKQAIND